MNNNYMDIPFNRIFDFRTLFNLSFIEVVVRYVQRVILFTSTFLLLASYNLLGYNFDLGIVCIITLLIVIIGSIYLSTSIIYSIRLKSFILSDKDGIMRKLHILFRDIPNMPDERRQRESINGLKFAKELARISQKAGIAEQVLMFKRYAATFYFHRHKIRNTMKTINSCERYFKNLSNRISSLREVKAEAARIKYTKLTVNYALNRIGDRDTKKELDDLIIEFRLLDLKNEEQAAIDFRRKTNLTIANSS